MHRRKTIDARANFLTKSGKIRVPIPLLPLLRLTWLRAKRYDPVEDARTTRDGFNRRKIATTGLLMIDCEGLIAKTKGKRFHNAAKSCNAWVIHFCDKQTAFNVEGKCVDEKKI